MQSNALFGFARQVLTLAACACLPWICPAAMAQIFPVKPVRVIVPFPPGGADVTLRIVQASWQEELGQPVVIENRAGANGIIGTDYMTKQAPDGYTLVWTASNPIVTGPVTTPKETTYDPNRDMTHISKLLTGVVTIAAPSALPVNSLREFIDYAKRNPGKLSFGSVGIGSSQHIDGEILKLRAGIDMLHVPYKGFGQVLPDLVADRIQLAFIAYLSAVAQLNAGKLKVLAITGRPYARMPGMPVVDEVVPGFERLPVWSASLHAPAGLPRPVLNRIHASILKILTGTDLRRKFEDDGYVVTINTPEEFAAEVRSSLEKTAALIKLSGVQIQ
ncbi:MAG: tripartite tricarboxylate transporter substrate binding protein [Betaproteobacteria bacterium]|nr:tripartite tricarboxylate transporter substrate binding protein [Betaproteobacteria bacterium]